MAARVDRVRQLIRALPLAMIDAMATIVAFLIATWGTRALELDVDSLWFVAHLGYLVVVNLAIFAIFRMYNSMWEYASIDDAARIVIATLVGSVVGDATGALLFGGRMPMRVYFCAWAILLVICGTARFLIRANSNGRRWSFMGIKFTGLPRTLVVGAGESGSLVVSRMLAGNDEVSGCPIAFVDDDLQKIGRRIHGVRVVGSCGDIARICARNDIDQIVVAMPSATTVQRQRVFGLCVETGRKVLMVPEAIKNVPESQIGKLPIRDVEVSDLLARDEIDLDESLVGTYLGGATVLVTGGGGSIGSEIVRQLLSAKPAKIVLFDIYENTVYELYHEIASEAKAIGVDIVTEIGSITHIPALQKVFERHHPRVVFHAAAHKHVPLMESNPREAIENNIFGTLNVVRMAHEEGCSHFILISTDKAVNPVNIMGATKRACEMIVQSYARKSSTIFAAVRFGNVLGSHGSVIPLFKRQLKNGGPITVTHKDITRYFMTIPEASRLVITAGVLARGGRYLFLIWAIPSRYTIWLRTSFGFRVCRWERTLKLS